MVVIVKPTFSCNACCDYCEVYKLGDLFKPMRKEIYELLVNKITKFLKKNKKPHNQSVGYYWLGGEPLAVGDEFYAFVKEVTDKSDIKSTHFIQSNLTLLAKKEFSHLKALLKKYKKGGGGEYFFSTSVDPVSDARKLKNGKNYNKSFIQALQVLKRDRAKYSAVYTVHKGSIGKEKQIYYYFKNLGFVAFNINAICDYATGFKDESFISMTPMEYGEFLCRMWDIWIEDNCSVNIIPFDGWKHLKEKKSQSKLRCFNDGKCNRDLCAISPNGDVFTCDRAMQAKQNPLGNIYKNEFEEMFTKKYHDKRIKYLKENDCKDCKWWNFCKGSCPYESKGEYEGKFTKSYWCESYKMLFNYIH